MSHNIFKGLLYKHCLSAWTMPFPLYTLKKVSKGILVWVLMITGCLLQISQAVMCFCILHFQSATGVGSASPVIGSGRGRSKGRRGRSKSKGGTVGTTLTGTEPTTPSSTQCILSLEHYTSRAHSHDSIFGIYISIHIFLLQWMYQ